MSLVIYNTLTRTKERFVPIEPGQVRMYVCGPTVYSEAHVGHAMSAITFDVIRRYLEYSGFKVEHVQNFTDVDDKIIQRAASLGVEPRALAQQLIDAWMAETAALNIQPATYYPRATQDMPTIISMIEGLIERGHAYPVDGGDVFYRVDSFPEYGKLSHRDIEEMLPGARIDIDPRKEDAMDFALWKGAKPGEPAWDSPWGPGRPGWHIECSAMIYEHLGPQIDIHGGGADLIFPHHENEIAQSEAFLDCPPLARFWVHNGLLQLGGEKMSKSIGNLITIRELLERGDGQAFRFLVLSSVYRNPLTFNEESMESARRGLARLAGAVRDFDAANVPAAALDHPLTQLTEETKRRFREAMDDDFNTPVALAQLFELARAINREQDAGSEPSIIAYAQATLKELAGVLGLTLVAATGPANETIDPFVELLLEIRQRLRQEQQWVLADEIRKRLGELGINVEDTAQGSTWRRE